MDINPALLLPRGEGILVLDATIIRRG